MENKEFNSEKSLEIISEMIASTRNKFAEDGFHFLLWGIIIVICCLVQFIMIEFMQMPAESNYVWILMPFVGGPISMWYGAKHRKAQKVKTLIDEFYKYIWIGFGASMFCTIFLSVSYKHTPTPFILILMAFAVYISGIVLKFKPLVYGSIVFWVSSILIYFMPSDAYQLLLFAISVMIGYIIPGFLLRNTHKTNTHV